MVSQGEVDRGPEWGKDVEAELQGSHRPLCLQFCQHHPEPALPHPRQPVLRRPGGPGLAADQLPHGARHGE